ncbi:MAG: AsmA family protein, partial [Hyphomicrobiaceae bacterium]|nr:AsmA family protein [Hyphomicrobiaceae bacterium]
MRSWAISSASASRAIAMGSLAAALLGLPVAVELNEPDARRVSMGALASDRTPLTERVSLSNHLSLTLDGGLVSPATSSGNAVRLHIDDAALTLDLRKAGVAPESQLPEPQPPLVARIAGFNAGVLIFRGATLNVVSPSGRHHVLSDVNATISAVRKGSFKLVGTGRFNGQRISLEGAWSDPPLREGAQLPLRLTLRSAFLEAAFDGHLSANGMLMLTGHAEVRAQSLRRLAAWTGFGGGGDLMRSVTVAGPVEWSTSQMAFARASVDLDGNQATGALIFKFSGPRPSVDATLAFQELDLSRVLGPAGASQNPASEGGPRFLSTFDADLRVSASRIRAASVDTGRGAITIALNQGRLAADLVDFEIEGGTAHAQLNLDVNQKAPIAAIKLKAKGVDTGRLLAAQLRRNPLLGRANITFEGTTDSSSLADSPMRLSGRGQLELAEPGRLGLDLAALAYAAKAAPVVGWSAAGKGGTPFDNLTCRFRLLNGAVTLETVQARSGEQAVTASGQIDVPG